jgi:uncharacterized membrane protein
MTKKYFEKAFWIIVIALSTYYFYRGIRFRFFEEGIGESFWTKQFWYIFHISFSIAPLILGPIQFWKWFRQEHTTWHRFLGKIYIIGSLFGGLMALYLGITIDYEGSIAPLILLSLLWMFMTSAAWITILKKNVIAHRLFMIRSYTLALVFVFLRIIDDFPADKLFFYIQSLAIKDATQEWLSWVLPLLVVEFILSWWPLLNGSRIAR